MSNDIKKFEKKLVQAVLDPEDCHHEFVSGLHGRKLDFDKIQTGSKLYDQWIDTYVSYITQQYDSLPDVVIGVANGANRLAVSLAAQLGGGVVGLMSEKTADGAIIFNKSVVDYIQNVQPRFVLIVEDVGTTGGSSAKAAKAAKDLGAIKVAVLNTWQRADTLDALQQEGISHAALITKILPAYSADSCDLCKDGSRLISY